MKKDNNIIQEIRDLLKFLITLSIFFPTLMYSLSKLAGEPERKSADTMLALGGLVGLFLLDYFIFESAKDTVKIKYLRRIKSLLLAGVGLFIPLILFLSITKNSPVPSYVGYLFAIPFFGIMLIASVVTLLITVPRPKSKQEVGV